MLKTGMGCQKVENISVVENLPHTKCNQIDFLKKSRNRSVPRVCRGHAHGAPLSPLIALAEEVASVCNMALNS